MATTQVVDKISVTNGKAFLIKNTLHILEGSVDVTLHGKISTMSCEQLYLGKHVAIGVIQVKGNGILIHDNGQALFGDKSLPPQIQQEWIERFKAFVKLSQEKAQYSTNVRLDTMIMPHDELGSLFTNQPSDKALNESQTIK